MWDVHYHSHLGEDMLSTLYDHAIVFANFCFAPSKYDVVADWPMGQNLFLMSHPDVSLVNILLSITRVSLVQNKCVFCQLRVHFIGDPDITKTYLGIQHANILQYLHELNGNVHYINIYNVPTLNCAACKLQRVNRDERRQLYNCAAYRLQRFNRDEHSAVREQWIRPIPMLSV